MSDITKRLRQIMESNGLNYKTLGEKLDISDVAAGNFVKGTTKPSFDVLQRFVKVFPNLNSHWLLTGDGPKERTEGGDVGFLTFKNEVEILKFIDNNPERFEKLDSYLPAMKKVKEDNKYRELEKKMVEITRTLEALTKQSSN